MLRAKELMIYDWYKLETAKVPAIYRQVDYMFYGEFITHTWMQPIPLTEEILTKNGFVVCSNNRYMNMSNGVDIILRKNYIRVCVGSNKIDIRNKSVHSFQQILRLLDKREFADNFVVQ